MRIAIDLMGNDNSPKVLYETIIGFEKELLPHQTLLLIAEEKYSQELTNTDKCDLLFVKESIHMDESPLVAVRRKKDSSLAIGMRLLAEKRVDALVSGGNTGAIVATAIVSLPMLPFIERPALLAELPTETGSVAVLDVGANLTCKPHHLVQFAQIGALYQGIMHNNKKPKIGLLNIGTESEKGTTELRRTYQELQEYCSHHAHLEFVGNVEGPEVFRGNVDVLVTEGFTGNIFLKTAEGLATFILTHLEKNFPGNIAATQLYSYLNDSQYFGAILAGLDGLVIKVHGSSSPQYFLSGIKGALRLAEENLIHQLSQ